MIASDLLMGSNWLTVINIDHRPSGTGILDLYDLQLLYKKVKLNKPQK